jgi:SAM-dependent methyltransferase
MSDFNHSKCIKSEKIDRSNFDTNTQFSDETGLLNEGVSISEIGCGIGRLSSRFTQKGFSILCFDVDEISIKEGHLRYPDATIFIASGGGIPFKDASFDIVLSFDVLEHIPDVDAHLSEVKRVLKSSGFYLFQTPNKLTNVPFEIIKNRSLTEHEAYPCSLQTFWSLKRLLKVHGFEFRFVRVPVMNEFMEQKVKRVFGWIGLCLLRIVNSDRLLRAMRTNFYIRGATVK